MTLAIKHFFFKHPFVIVLICYFVVRLLFLTRLPIFNDEAIYLDWGWRETHVPGYLFYSLYDAKQPLLMWAFGASANIFSDPLFAGRFVSVLMGALSLTGIYRLSLSFFPRKFALLASGLYIIVPIFSFYDRQALMESAVGAVGIWCCYLTMLTLRDRTWNKALALGAVLGVGYFIKSTTLVFFTVSIGIILFSAVARHQKKEGSTLVSMVILSFVSVSALLFIQPEFWSTLHSNSRYVFSVAELVALPVTEWITRLSMTIAILLKGLSPSLFVLMLIGTYFAYKTEKRKEYIILSLWLCASFLVVALFSRDITPRYLMPVLPLAVIFVCQYFQSVSNRSSRPLFFVGIMSLILPVVLTGFQVYDPYSFLKTMSLGKDEGYISGQTSGYGIPEAVAFFQARSAAHPIFVATHLNNGNPESGIITYFQKNKNVTTGYFESADVGEIDSVDCLKLDRPLYYVTRRDEIGGLSKYFDKVTTITRPHDTYTIGIYKAKEECEGRTLQLSAIKT